MGITGKQLRAVCHLFFMWPSCGEHRIAGSTAFLEVPAKVCGTEAVRTCSAFFGGMPKPVLVPLFLGDPQAILHDLLRAQPGWGGLCVADHAKYLGFVLGPG